MTMYEIEGQAKAIPIGSHIVVNVPPASGWVTVGAQALGMRSFGEDAFDSMLEGAGLQKLETIEVDLAPSETRSFVATSEQPLSLDIVPPEGSGALILAEDESGALSWVLPDKKETRALSLGAAAGAAHFEVPANSPPAGGRSLFGRIFKKILKVFIYPITDFVIGAIAKPIVKHWELAKRPYLLRDYTIGTARLAAWKVPELGPADWARLAKGRALLLVHGTFSSCDGFRSLPPSTLGALQASYDNRIIALNHPTLHVGPDDNAAWLQQKIPSGRTLDVDIVCHSRGGLVAREIAASLPNVRVGKIVMVGVPNQGTVLANPDNVTSFIDRYTTIAKLVPGTAGAILDAVVFVVKILAHGLISQLAGIQAMNPVGPYLKSLAAKKLAFGDLYALASNFEPAPGSSLFNLARLADVVSDAAFAQAANDLVVPTKGMAQVSAGLSVSAANRCDLAPSDAVIHTEYFAETKVQNALLSWLGTTPAARSLDGSRGAARLSTETLRELRPHVVNLSEGRFARSGRYQTTDADVDAIFTRHLPEWAKANVAVGEPLRVAVWAHGGLIGEQAGLEIAHKHVSWWKRNGIYPIYFVWETGWSDALKSIASSVVQRVLGKGRRDLWDFTSDPIIERGCRALGGVHIWSAMKRNAQLASERDGGAALIARKLADLRKAHGALELHAVGHSAGSIFHSYFIPAALKLEVGEIKTLQLLAPAIRVDDFNERLLPLMGNGIASTTMYTMARELEEDDSCFGAYRKSLLYLIHHALERESRTPILGLELSATEDERVREAFGLGGRDNARAEVVWSRTDLDRGRSASQSATHGGFDDDPATMGSVAARVLGTEEPLVRYVGGERSFDPWAVSEDWLQGIDVTGWSAPGPSVSLPSVLAAPPPKPPAVPPRPSNGSGAIKTNGASTGQRRALCVGINAYNGPHALRGCVADAKRWSEVLKHHGFSVESLHDHDATRANIVEQLKVLLESCSAGDLAVFQFAGHGYHVPDLDGDEGGKDDQTLVPVDFETGAFLLDDDLRAILQGTPSGVAVTCFIDCCHSASNTRVFGGPNRKARSLMPSSADEGKQWEDAYRAFRNDLARHAPRTLSFGSESMTWVSFAACRDEQVAYEHDGQGDFTRELTALLLNGIDGLTHAEIERYVVEKLKPAQQPWLDCPDAQRDLLLFTR